MVLIAAAAILFAATSIAGRSAAAFILFRNAAAFFLLRRAAAWLYTRGFATLCMVVVMACRVSRGGAGAGSQ